MNRVDSPVWGLIENKLDGEGVTDGIKVRRDAVYIYPECELPGGLGEALQYGLDYEIFNVERRVNRRGKPVIKVTLTPEPGFRANNKK